MVDILNIPILTGTKTEEVLVDSVTTTGSGHVSPTICPSEGTFVTISTIVTLKHTRIVKAFAKANNPSMPKT